MSTCEEEERVRGLSLTSICMVQNTGVRLQQAVQPDHHHLQQLIKKQLQSSLKHPYTTTKTTFS